LVNNDHPSAARSFTVGRSVPVAPVATIPNGMKNVSIYLDTVQEGQQLQIMTRDGRQLLGQSLADNSDLQGVLFTTDHGFAEGASYTDAYLNGSKQSVKLSGTANDAQSFLGVDIEGSSAGNSAAQTAALILANKATVLAGAQALAAGITDLRADPNDATQLIVTSNQTSPARATLSATTSGGIGFATGVDLRYKEMSVFYGAQAEVQLQPIYNSNDQITGTKAFPALLQGGALQDLSGGIGENALTLNGVSLGALEGPVAGAMDVATWINAQSTLTGVTATAINEIRPDAASLKLGFPLVINGVAIDDAQYATTQLGLATAINAAQAAYAGTFTAKINAQGELTITNAAGYEGEDITIAATTATDSSAVNALGLSSKTYRGQVSLTQALLDSDGLPISKPIQLGFGSTGTPADLAQLGFRTGAHISGSVKDDLLVFVTGAGVASVSASYAGQATDPAQALRTQPMSVKFLTNTRYQITDTASNTVLAERTLDPNQLTPGISFQGLQLSFTAAPKSGDQFAMDGNADGIGNNENMLAMNALETKAVVGKKTLSNAYIDHVNEMGNIARQATISQTALTVVHDQAVKSRDEVSGVSLDREAGDLIRYQQAYQAAAKTLQVASQLFDSVLQIR
jgi:flagellar hook-associated protein FlgK